MKKREIEKQHRVDDKRKLVAFDEEKHIYSAGQSTVEVIVKLRRKKEQDVNNVKPSSSAVLSQAEQPFRTGSWGDLFNQQRQQRHHQSKKYPEAPILKSDKEIRGKEIQRINTELKKENDSLKMQTSILSEDLSKAKAELKECFMTIKDLRELSDLLKYENECLTGSRKQRQEIEEIHKRTVAENQMLRAQLSKFSKQYTEVTAPKDQQISKFRNAIKEMKSTIEDEIDEMRHKHDNLLEISPSLFQHARVAESESILLNDSNPLNASDFQKILNSASCSSLSLQEGEGDASSTQYMAVPKASGSQASSSNSEMAEWLRQKHELIRSSANAQ